MSSHEDQRGAPDDYQVAARLYDLVVDPMITGLRRAGLKLAAPQAGEQVLDVGCGTGTMLQLFAARGCRVAGVDLSPAMAARARQRLGPDATVHQGDASATPFEAGRFDLISSVLVLHAMDPALRLAVLREAARVCRADGRLLLVDFHPGQPRGLRGQLQRALTFSIERLAGGEHFRNYRQFMGAGGLPPLLEQAGLRVERERYVGRGNFALLVVGTG